MSLHCKRRPRYYFFINNAIYGDNGTELGELLSLLNSPQLMEAIATSTVTRLIEFPVQPLRAYIKSKDHRTAKIKTRHRSSYPKSIMPEQPTGYIRARENDCL
jgi:hypothetical protein